MTLQDVLSFDGKTIRAVPEDGSIRHILSLFSHTTHLAIGQVGIDGKGKEIPAFEDLLTQGAANKVIAGSLLLGDALHTQKAACKAVLKAGADYLFTIKDNQRKLKRTLTAELDRRQANNPALRDTYTYTDKTRGRHVTTTVALVTATSKGEEMLPPLVGSNHWDGVQTMGILRRTGVRTGKEKMGPLTRSMRSSVSLPAGSSLPKQWPRTCITTGVLRTICTG